MYKRSIYIIDDDDDDDDDDEYDVRFTLENIFRFAGYTVKSFATASVALEHKLSDRDSCIALALHMPEMGDLAFQVLLKDRNIRIPIVIYTGKVDVQTAVMALTDGVYVITKNLHLIMCYLKKFKMPWSLLKKVINIMNNVMKLTHCLKSCQPESSK